MTLDKGKIAAREQPHPLALALNDQAIAVMLDFVDPLRPIGNFRRLGRYAGFEWGFWHVTKIGGAHENAIPQRSPP